MGHGDEFQATGGIERVEVKPETDQMLGIIVTPIAAATDGSSKVMIPVTALVDADGKQLVFVQYENFYEPVEITTGATEGELIEVTNGLSVGEQLVTQGSLSLYAESRKTQSTDTTQSSDNTSKTEETTSSEIITTDSSTHAQADQQGIPHNHDQNGNLVKSEGFPIFKILIALVGLGIVGLMGLFTISAFVGNTNKKNTRRQYRYNPED